MNWSVHQYHTPIVAEAMVKWDAWLAQLQNNRCNMQNVVCYMTPSMYSLFKQMSGITRYMVTTDDRQEHAVSRLISSLDGIPIRIAPESIMKSSFVFTTGWVAASGAKQVNMILVDTSCIAAPVKYETSMVSDPTAQSKGKYLYYERYYYGAFKLNNRNGIVVNAAA